MAMARSFQWRWRAPASTGPGRRIQSLNQANHKGLKREVCTNAASAGDSAGDVNVDDIYKVLGWQGGEAAAMKEPNLSEKVQARA